MSKLEYKILLGISVIILSIGLVSIGDTFAQTNEIPELLSDVQTQDSQIKAESPSQQNTTSSDNLIRESKQVYVNTSVFEEDKFTITTFDKIITITKDSSKVIDDYTTW